MAIIFRITFTIILPSFIVIIIIQHKTTVKAEVFKGKIIIVIIIVINALARYFRGPIKLVRSFWILLWTVFCWDFCFQYYYYF